MVVVAGALLFLVLTTTREWRFEIPQIMTVSTVMTTMSFFLPLAIGECRAVPTDLEGWSPAGVESLHRLVTLNCHHGYYNEVNHAKAV